MKTILLVEDNDDFRELLGMVLRADGYDVCEAENGLAALHQLATMPEQPCVLLLDLMMPVMSGPELLKALREEDKLDALPVIVLSAGGDRKHAPEAQRFLRKPVAPREVRDVVREVCGHP